MKSLISVAVMALLCFQNFAQNVGIGTTSPTGPLTFASTLGNKIVLYGTGTTGHYGIGVQSATLQFYTDLAASNISFGYGRSAGFTERMRIYNTGLEGMYLNGRLHLRNGDPANTGGGGGTWLYKPDNSAAIGFMGVQNSQNIGFFGGSAGWGFTYNTLNSRVGIGNENPNAPLAFGATLGKKITLYPGTTGDVGFGVAGNRLQIFADNPNADVAIGYDAAGTFNERFAVKPSGALAIYGNIGSYGQILTSGGTGSAFWQPVNSIIGQAVLPEVTYTIPTNVPADIPGASFTINAPTNGKIILWVNTTSTLVCTNPLDACTWVWQLKTFLNNSEINTWFIHPQTQPTQPDYSHSAGPLVMNVTPGTYTIKFRQALISIIAPPTIRVSAYAQFIAN